MDLEQNTHLFALAKLVFTDFYFFIDSHTESFSRDTSLLFRLVQKQLLFRGSSLQELREKAELSGKMILPLQNFQK